MDRIIIGLLFCFALSASADEMNWLDHGGLHLDAFKGSVAPNKQKFGTVLDNASNNNKITLLVDVHPDKRVAGYLLRYGTETGVYTAIHDCRMTLETGCTVSGLTNGITYYFVAQTYGINPAITSGYSNEVSGEP